MNSLPCKHHFFQPSFFNDTVIFSTKDQQKSIKAFVLSHLERWLSTSPSCLSGKYFQATITHTKNSHKTAILYHEMSSLPKGFLSNKLLMILKVVATILVLPRIVAELIRYGLRRSFASHPSKIYDKKAPKKSHEPIYLFSTHKVKDPATPLSSDLLKADDDLCLKESSEAQEILQTLLPMKLALMAQKPLPGVTYLPTSKPYLQIAFKMDSYPQFIFKTRINLKDHQSASYDKTSLDKEIKNIEILQEALEEINSSNLFIPSGFFLYHPEDPHDFSVIVEEYLDIPSDSQLCSVWEKNTEQHPQFFIDLALLLVKTDLKYTGMQNFPIVTLPDKSVRIAILNPKDFSPPKSEEQLFDELPFFFKDLPNKFLRKQIFDAVVQDVAMFASSATVNQISYRLRKKFLSEDCPIQ